MKRALVVFAAFVSVSLLGCGGQATGAEPDAPTEESSTVSQSGTCTALCAGGQTVSCTGTTCSATDYSGVSCSGQPFIACPSSSCDFRPCSDFQGACLEGFAALCCDGGVESRCDCMSGSWNC
jgi:hypothetical protein